MAQPASDTAWRIEQNGINPVAVAERHSTPANLFWVWFAANLAIVGLVLGAVVMSYGLSLFQGLLSLLGVFSFILIGYFAIPGARTGVPTMILSRATFGTRGNFLPSIVSWLNLVGWETVVLVIATYAFEAALQAAFGLAPSTVTTVLSLVVVMGIAFSVAVLGHATLVRVQTIFSYLFGALSIVVAVLLLPHINLAKVIALPSGSWLKGFLPALSIIIAGTGLSWVNTASDYTRYLPKDVSHRTVVSMTTWGSAIPAISLMALGVFLYGSFPKLATTANPIGLLQQALPTWVAVPYLLTAVASMVTGDIMDIYSSGLSLLAAEVKIPRYKTVLVDAVLSVGGSLYILLVAQNFIGTFEAFLTLLAGVLAPWAAVFLIDLPGHLRQGIDVEALYRHGDSRYGRYRVPALVSWGVGLVVSLLFTSTLLFQGPLAIGIFNGSDLGFLLGFAVSAIIYGIWPNARSLGASSRLRRGV